MATKFRKSPPVCLVISIGRLLIGKLRLSKHYLDKAVKTEDGQEFIIFRHITNNPIEDIEQSVTYVVRFKFARLSHNANRIASIIPMLLITGFPGFQTKMYAVNKENGCWQGMYQWKSKRHLDDYLKSFVYKMMNKRAIKETIRTCIYSNHLLNSYINEPKITYLNAI